VLAKAAIIDARLFYFCLLHKMKNPATLRVAGFFFLVGLPGIEPGLHEPESCVLPAYASPVRSKGLGPLTFRV
jgi:hypothetical protein